MGKSFLSHTYTTFFLDRKEIWVSQPSEEKYMKLIEEKKEKSKLAHESMKKHNLSIRKKIWNNSDYQRMVGKAESQHMSSYDSIMTLGLASWALIISMVTF